MWWVVGIGTLYGFLVGLLDSQKEFVRSERPPS